MTINKFLRGALSNRRFLLSSFMIFCLIGKICYPQKCYAELLVTDQPIEQQSPASDWKKTNINEKTRLWGDSYTTYTVIDLDDFYPYRHSYFWLRLSLEYDFAPNYTLTGKIKSSKYSFSNDLSWESFSLRFFPTVSYTGSLSEMFFIEPNSWAYNPKLIWQVGTIDNFSHGHGLYFQQMTGLGMLQKWIFNVWQLDLSAMGSGYASGDDVIALYAYDKNQYFGIGLISESRSYLGDRAIPSMLLRLPLGKILSFYSEAGLSYAYQKRSSDYQELYLDSKHYGYQDEQLQNALSYQDKHSLKYKDFLGKDNLAALVGVNFDYTVPEDLGLPAKIILTLVNEIRFYGWQTTEFYAIQRYTRFDFYTDINTNEKFNNQPFNFYLYGGQSQGLYARQQICIKPTASLKLITRNELLYIQVTRSPVVDGGRKNYGNDVLSQSLALNLHQNLEMGVSVYNYLIGYIEEIGFLQQDDLQRQRGPLLLEAADSFYIDFYLYIRI